MATQTTFTSPFRPATTFFTGPSGSTLVVPDVFPVAINGRPYMLDMSSNQFTRQFDARVRDSVDQSTEPGEAALNPQGLWRRSQSSWHYGAGQQYSDSADAEAFRFYTSKGVDVWTKNRLSLLPDTTKVYPSSGTPGSNLFMVTAGTRLYLADGQTLKYTTDLSSYSTVTGTPVATIVGLASDGNTVYVAYDDDTVYTTTASTTSASSYITNTKIGHIDFVKNRLIAGGRSTDQNDLWEITAGGNNLTPNLMTHSNAAWTWVAFAAGQNHIYAAGFSGNKSLVYKTEIKDDATGLDTPSVAAELPFGEIIRDIHGYLGYIVIGLNDGFRFCSSDDAGNLIVGPKIVTGSAVEEFAGIGQYIYFSWKNFDLNSTGIGRMDISVFISPNQPAYASDLMATAQGSVNDVHEFNGKPIFSVASVGIYAPHATDLVATGSLRSGIYRWGVPDAKYVPKIDIRCLPLEGSVVVSIASDGGTFYEFPPFDSQGNTESTIDGLQDRVFEAEIFLTLNRDIIASLGPTVTRWMARAYAAPLRSEIFQVPLLMHHKLSINGREYWQDVDTEMTLLRELVKNPIVVNYQENQETFSVVVENVQMLTRQLVEAHQSNDFEGTAIVVMRSVG